MSFQLMLARGLLALLGLIGCLLLLSSCQRELNSQRSINHQYSHRKLHHPTSR